ncbi:hypothetical protein PIB30_084543 [Stylosanthes scabra]|uniref:Uncharacterized protein n=1 Tax=Stylosanthes scabra TaxID=79078 RepID=A0ABU6ZRV9_9FABA|nr:hypothetical protein [Stylosanthes scabra]
MENREPEQNHTPRHQLAMPRRRSSCPSTWKLCPSVPLATFNHGSLSPTFTITPRRQNHTPRRESSRTNSSKPRPGALSQRLGVLLIKAQPHEDQGHAQAPYNYAWACEAF